MYLVVSKRVVKQPMIEEIGNREKIIGYGETKIAYRIIDTEDLVCTDYYEEGVLSFLRDGVDIVNVKIGEGGRLTGKHYSLDSLGFCRGISPVLVIGIKYNKDNSIIYTVVDSNGKVFNFTSDTIRTALRYNGGINIKEGNSSTIYLGSIANNDGLIVMRENVIIQEE